jgi:hypothetical protein
MQDKDVRAFRQRLLRAGFKDVSISCYRDDVYLRCVSPQNEKIKRQYKLGDVKFLPVIKYLL